jgi:hypothetical protein
MDGLHGAAAAQVDPVGWPTQRGFGQHLPTRQKGGQLGDALGCGHRRIEKLYRGYLQSPLRSVFIAIEPELHQRVPKLAMAIGANITLWLRHLLCQVTVADFPLPAHILPQRDQTRIKLRPFLKNGHFRPYSLNVGDMHSCLCKSYTREAD